MPFVNKTPVILGSSPAIFPSDSGVVAQRSQATLSAADVALNSVGAFVILPAGCVPAGVHLDCDASISADIGVLNDAETALSTAAADGGAAWAAAVAANGTSTLYTRAMARVLPAGVDRKIGVRVTTAGSAGVHGMTLFYRSA
jgi:hypothetical protein